MSSTSTQIPTLSRSNIHTTLIDENPSIIPSRTLNPPLSVSARTRSMTKLSTYTSARASRLSIYLDPANPDTKKSNARKGLKRQPLMPSLVNAMNTDKKSDEPVKRKGAEYTGDRPRKVMKYNDENMRNGKVEGTGLLMPVRKMNEPTTPIRKTHNTVKPTPAREILRQNADIDDDEDETISSPLRLVARPPTPPRPHMALTEDILMLSSSPTRKQPLDSKTSNDGSPRPNKMTATSRLLPPQSPVSRFAYLTKTPTKTPRAGGSGSTLGTTPRKPVGGISKFKSPAPPARAKASSEGMKQMTLSGFSGFGMKRSEGKASLIEENEEDEGMDVDDPSAPGPSAQDEMVVAVNVGEMEPAQEDIDAPAVEESEQVISSATGTDRVSPLEMASRPKLDLDKVGDLPKASASITDMPPPSRIPTASRIPRRAAATSTSTRAPPLQIDQQPTALTKRTILPPRRSIAALGRGFPSVPSAPSAQPSQSSTTVPTTSSIPTKRKPSYPSSLGSGPLAQPRARMVSGPVPQCILDPTPGASTHPRQSPRSVSAPFPASSTPRLSGLSASTSRREGLSMETSKSIAGLSDALLKLKMRKIDYSTTGPEEKDTSKGSSIPRAPELRLPGLTTTIDTSSSRTLTSSTSRLSSVHRPRQSLAALADGPGEGGVGDRSLAALVVSNAGQGIMRGVVAFVDVKTADGDDVSSIFSDMLKALGAKVLTRPTESLTHIIYKAGKPSTLSWWRKQDEEARPFVVGLTWITKSKERLERLDEGLFKVDVEGEDVFQKRRKSMEPKAFNALNRSVGGGLGLGMGMPSLLQETALNVAQARRKSLLYAPRISSPLKKAYGRALPEED